MKDSVRLISKRCIHCQNMAILTDAFGFSWCEQHRHRGDLVNKGAQRKFPDLQCQPFAIGEGKYCWGIAVNAGRDELIWMALSAIEHLETAERIA